MTRRSDSLIIVGVIRALVPFIQLFALYVVFHGHYSPGGGFQGGAMLAASLMLLRLSVGREAADRQLARRWATVIGALGTLVFAGVGLVALGFGGAYLDYKFLPLPGLSEPELRSLGILFVEIGIAVALMAILLAVFEDLVEGHEGA